MFDLAPSKSRRPKSIERILIDNKAEAVANNSVSAEQEREIKPKYDALVAELTAKDISVPSMLEFVKGVNTVELCECRDFALKNGLAPTSEEQLLWSFDTPRKNYYYKELVFTPELLKVIQEWRDETKCKPSEVH